VRGRTISANKAIYLFLVLCVSSTVFMVDARAASNVNLASIPHNWENYQSQGYLAHGNGPQIIFVDSNVVRTTGKPSIRIEPHTAADLNTARECNGIWYPVKPGDHIVAKCWVKIDDNGDRYAFSGARIGIDLYSGNTLLPATAFWNTYFGGDFSKMYVHWGTVGWAQRTIDIIVPATVGDSGGNPVKPTSLVLWAQVWSSQYGGTEQGNAWFADAELYINPTGAPSLVTRTLTVLSSANGQGSTRPGVGTQSYTDKSVAPVIATPNAGYELVDWILDGASQLPWWPKGTNPLYITMDTNHTIKPVFAARAQV